jgi:uracil-DNA glycosylase family 4
MDGREQLKRYLEQRREAGERELVLDQLNVDEVLKLVGAGPKTRDKATRPAENPPLPPSTPGSEHASADWREVLRSSGASPDKGSEHREARQVAAGMPTEPAAIPTAREPLPAAGLIVGSDDRQLFSGALAELDSLESVAQAVRACTRCPLYATATNPVPGEGSSTANLMIVGEAPGATEDETGRPFVGAAGQLLTKILAAVDLKREDTFICNVLKHRPPGNRNPMPDEVTACSPYLLRQVELIRPKAILALGMFAAQTLLQTKLAIGKLRGQVHRFHGVPLIVTYHPAALLRNPSWKRPTWEDVQLVRRILDRSVAQP